MTGLFDAFNKSTDSTALTPFQTETMTAVGVGITAAKRGAGRKANNDPQLARQMVGGRHAVSESVLQGYATAGVDVTPELQADLDELDNFALTTQTIGEMDAASRADMIRRGHQGFRRDVLDQKEAAIVKRIADRSRDVLTEKAQLDRILKRQSVQANSIELEAAQRTNALQRELDKAREITENMTLQQLNDSYKGNGINGITRTMHAQMLFERSKQEADIVKNLALTDPTTVGFFGNVGGGASSNSSSRGVDRVEKLSHMDPNILGSMLEEAVDMAVASDDQLIPTITVPGTQDEVSLAELQEAATKQQERENELGEARGASFRVNAQRVHTNYAATVSLFAERTTALGMQWSPNSPVADELYQLQDNYREQISGGNWQGAQETVNQIKTFQDSVFSDFIQNQPEARQGALSELLLQGKLITADTTLDYLVDSSGAAAAYEVQDNNAYRETNDYLQRWLAQVSRGQESDDVIGSAFAETVDPETAREARRSMIANNVSSEAMAQIFQQEFQDTIFTEGLAGVFARAKQGAADILETGTPDQKMAAEQQLTVLNRVEKTFFGATPAAKQITNRVDGMLVKLPAVFPDGKGGQVQLLDDAGNPVERTLINPVVLSQTIDAAQGVLDDGGVDIQLKNALVESIQQQRQQLVTSHIPNTLRKHSLMFGMSAEYRLDPSADGGAVVGRIYDRSAGDLIKAMALAEGEPITTFEAFNNASNEAQSQAIDARIEEILANPQEHYVPRLGGASIANVNRAAAHNQALREFQNGDTNPGSGSQLGGLIDSLFNGE